MPPNVELKAKMRQIQFRLELHPRPCWRAYRAPSDTLAGFKGPADKVTGRERRESREEKGPLYFFLQIYGHVTKATAEYVTLLLYMYLVGLSEL